MVLVLSRGEGEVQSKYASVSEDISIIKSEKRKMKKMYIKGM
jgi:hypothetical protein